MLCCHWVIFKDRVTVTVINVGQKMRQGCYDESAYSVVLLKTEERSYLGDQVVDGRLCQNVS